MQVALWSSNCQTHIFSNLSLAHTNVSFSTFGKVNKQKCIICDFVKRTKMKDYTKNPARVCQEFWPKVMNVKQGLLVFLLKRLSFKQHEMLFTKQRQLELLRNGDIARYQSSIVLRLSALGIKIPPLQYST